MKATTITYRNAEIQLSLQELEVFKNVLKEIQLALPEPEFEIRVGVSYRQARGFLESLIQEIEQSGESLMNISCSVYEITLLNNLLNEVCHGIRLDNFEIKVGIPREEVKQFLFFLNKVMNEMTAIQAARKASLMPSPPDLIKSKKNCCLEAEGYQVTFYFKKLISFKNSVGVFIVLNLNTPVFTEFFISSIPQMISTEDLWNLVKDLEKPLEIPEGNLTNIAMPLQIYQGDIFQLQALERGVTSDGEEYATLNFMLSLTRAKDKIIRPYVGVQAAVFFKNIRRFTLSMREVLTELSE
jgi:hypothetical protein